MEKQVPQNPIPVSVQPVNQAPAKTNNSLVVFLFVLLLIAVSLTGFFALQTQRLAKELAQYQTQPSPSPSPAINLSRDEVLGIQINTCCSCPTKISKSLIGKDGWVLYERGKNYSSLLPKICEGADCAPCPQPQLEESSAKVKECYAKTQCEGAMPCMANPAAVFCACMGGELETRENDQGQYGVCNIDGKEYDEWEYFRSMNPEDKIYNQQ